MKNITRSTRLAVVPAVVAAFALSACQDEAPTAAPPTPASPTAQQTEAAPTEEPSEDAPETSEEPSESSAEPSSSEAGGKEECDSRVGQRIEREDVKPEERTKAQKVKSEYGDGGAEITLGEVKVDTTGGDDYFPGEGMQTVIVPVTIKAENGSFLVSELGMSVSDGADEVCQRDISNGVVPPSDEIPVETLKDGDSITGKVGFAVPVGADLSKYTFNYAVEYNSGEADVVWKLK